MSRTWVRGQCQHGWRPVKCQGFPAAESGIMNHRSRTRQEWANVTNRACKVSFHEGFKGDVLPLFPSGEPSKHSSGATDHVLLCAVYLGEVLVCLARIANTCVRVKSVKGLFIALASLYLYTNIIAQVSDGALYIFSCKAVYLLYACNRRDLCLLF